MKHLLMILTFALACVVFTSEADAGGCGYGGYYGGGGYVVNYAPVYRAAYYAPTYGVHSHGGPYRTYYAPSYNYYRPRVGYYGGGYGYRGYGYGGYGGYPGYSRGYISVGYGF